MNVNNIQNIISDKEILFLSYGGFLSQNLISGMTEVLEKEAEFRNLNMGISNKIFTIFIELSQNIMNYSINEQKSNKSLSSKSLILVRKDENYYYIHSQNVITTEDKLKLEPKIKDIPSLNNDEIKKRYRELRRSGADKHGKGAGIGFYEIAKISNKIEFDFIADSENKWHFHTMSKISIIKD